MPVRTPWLAAAFTSSSGTATFTELVKASSTDHDPSHKILLTGSRHDTALSMSQSQDDHEIPEHDIRRFIADSDDETFVSYRSLQDARQDPNSAVVLSGDYGGTIFLTVPVRLLRCSVSTLWTLVSDLDAVTWMSGNLTIATVALERHAVGSGVMGGQGGGLGRRRWFGPTRPHFHQMSPVKPQTSPTACGNASTSLCCAFLGSRNSTGSGNDDKDCLSSRRIRGG